MPEIKRCSKPSLHNFKKIEGNSKCQWCGKTATDVMMESLKEMRRENKMNTETIKKFDSNSIQLHLGCGERNLGKDWIHIDLDDYPHIDYHHDIHDLPMFDDNTADEIYCSHTLEYFDRQEAEDVLSEWYRVLKPHGILRVAVPDFEGIVKVYWKYKDVEHKGILGPLYGRRPLGNGLIFHRTVYDFNSLKKMLERIKFTNVHRYDPDEVLPKGFDDQSIGYVPHCDRKGILVSLNIEATK